MVLLLSRMHPDNLHSLFAPKANPLNTTGANGGAVFQPISGETLSRPAK